MQNIITNFEFHSLQVYLIHSHQNLPSSLRARPRNSGQCRAYCSYSMTCILSVLVAEYSSLSRASLSTKRKLCCCTLRIKCLPRHQHPHHCTSCSLSVSSFSKKKSTFLLPLTRPEINKRWVYSPRQPLSFIHLPGWLCNSNNEALSPYLIRT